MQLTEEQQKELQKKLKNMSPEQLQELQKQNCIFCKIIKGEIPARIVFEDDLTIAVLDINPAAKGHILILPKEHYAILPQVNDKQLAHLFVTAKKLSQALLKSLKEDEFQPAKKAKKAVKKSSAEVHIPKKKEEADLDDISSLFK